MLALQKPHINLSLRTLPTNLMVILMAPRAILNNIPKLLKRTASTRSILAVRQRSRRLVGHKTDEVLRSTLAVARDLLHADVAQERNEIAHSPGASPVDAVGGKFFAGAGRGVEDSEGGGDEGWDFAVGEAEEEALVLGPACASGRVVVVV
jgi:hypothetical protein